MRFEVESNGHRHSIEARRGASGWQVSFDGRLLTADVSRIGQRWSLLMAPSGPGPDAGDAAGFRRGARSYDIAIEGRGRSERIVHVDGQAVQVSLAPARAVPAARRDAAGAATGPARVESPMAGRIVRVLVSVGERVAARQGLVVMEAMKMENELRAPRAGTVTAVRAAAGASIDA